MKYYGLQKLTLIDFPETVAAMVFVPGCNLRCPFCHNPGLVHAADREHLLPFDEILSFLEKRKKVLGGICISGGEPLLDDELPALVAAIRSFGLKVKIDTNGTMPDRLAEISADFIAMDIKTSPAKYQFLGGNGIAGIREKLEASIRLILSRNIPHEFRTTIAPGIVTADDIDEICSLVNGTTRYVLTQFRPINTLDPRYEEYPPTSAVELHELQAIALAKNIPCTIRFSLKQEHLSKD